MGAGGSRERLGGLRKRLARGRVSSVNTHVIVLEHAFLRCVCIWLHTFILMNMEPPLPSTQTQISFCRLLERDQYVDEHVAMAHSNAKLDVYKAQYPHVYAEVCTSVEYPHQSVCVHTATYLRISANVLSRHALTPAHAATPTSTHVQEVSAHGVLNAVRDQIHKDFLDQPEDDHYDGDDGDLHSMCLVPDDASGGNDDDFPSGADMDANGCVRGSMYTVWNLPPQYLADLLDRVGGIGGDLGLNPFEHHRMMKDDHRRKWYVAQ